MSSMLTTFLFDLDGTLCDSKPGLMHASRAAIAALGLECEDPSVFLGAPLPMMFRTLSPHIDDLDIEYGLKVFRDVHHREGLAQMPLYDGVVDLLKALQIAGRSIWLATSKPQSIAEEVVSVLGIAGYFDGVCGAGPDEKDRKADLIARALKNSGSRAEHALMLGDRAFDVVGALENSVTPVGALWGYGSREELAEAGCVHFAKDIHDFSVQFVMPAR